MSTEPGAGHLTTQIWKRFGLRVDRPTTSFDQKENREANDRLTNEMKKMVAAAKAQQGETFSVGELADPDAVSIERLVPLQRGKWRIMPPGVEADSP